METVIYHAEVDSTLCYININYVFIAGQKNTIRLHKHITRDLDRDFPISYNMSLAVDEILKDLAREGILYNQSNIHICKL